jgi:hypothetical protein
MVLSVQNKVPAPKPPTRRRHAPTSSKVLETGLAVSGLAAGILILWDISGPAISVFKLVVCLVLPGWAVLRRLPDSDPAARLVWMAVTSAAIYTIFALLMVWSEFWHPRPAAAVALLAASALIVLSPVEHRSGSRRFGWRMDRLRLRGFKEFLPWLILGAAILLWGVAMAMTGSGQMGDFGLLPEFPAIWYLAVGLVVGLSIWGVAARRVGSPWIMSASLTGLVVMLYASASLLAVVPRLPWTYKHIAVTDLIGAVGRVDPSIDIYNRWPGFFSLSAFLGEVIGYRDALAYASWAEIGFALVDVVIVLAIARAISTNPRVYWTATLVFILTNWVNQNYYSPQAFSFTLYLTMCLIALTFLRGTPNRWVCAIEERLKRRHLLEGRQLKGRHLLTPEEYGERHGRSLRMAAIIAILVLQAVIVVSHQLTPYLAVLGLFPLFILGHFRPKWLGPALVVIALAYLLPNLDYVEGKYGLFSGFDVFANASYNPPQVEHLTDAGRWQARGTQVLSVFTGLLGMAGFLRRLLQGKVRTTLMVAWLAVAPVLGLVAQSYGGEGRFRVYLFALPWLSIGVAWLFWAGPMRTRKAVLGAGASLAAMALLFTGIYFQPEAGYRVSRDDVVAGKWLDARVEPGDLVFGMNYFFPLLIGPNYPRYLVWEQVDTLSGLLKNSSGSVTANDVVRHADGIRKTDRIYLVFSDGQQRNAAARKLFDADVLPKFERELAASNIVESVFDNGAVRIYEITRTR